MQINHRKLLPQSNQTLTCSDCGPTCPHKCSYPEIFWPPEPPPHTTTTATTATHLSPYIIIIAALLGSAFLFITYYLIMVRCSTHFRRPPAARISGDPEDLSDDDDPTFELDHPIWYITTVGLQPSVINSISTVKFKKDDDLIDGSDCSVCLSEFRDGETLRLLPKCNHAFHIPCIDTWLRSHTNCPLCRAGILSNGLSAVLSPGDRSLSRGRSGSNADARMEGLENVGEIDRNVVAEGEIGEEMEDSKMEHESVTAARTSISVDSLD